MVADDAARGLAAVAAAIRELVSQAPEPQKISSIGVCAPGPLNPITGGRDHQSAQSSRLAQLSIG